MIHMSRKTAVTGLIVLCAFAILTVPAFAQLVGSVSSLPQQARVEGLTETMGAVQVTNVSTSSGTVKAGSSITVLYSGTITNLSTSTPASNQGVLTCSAGVTNTACAAGTTTVAVGVVSGGQLTVSFGGDTYFAPGAYILISQVRVNVNALGAGTSAVTATLSGTSSAPTTAPLTFTNATVPVAAIVSPSLNVSRTVNAGAFQTCAIAAKVFALKVTERYPAALTSVLDENAFTPAFVVGNGTTVQVVVTGVPAGLAVQQTGADTAGVGNTSLTTSVTPIGATNAVTSTGSPITFTFTIAGVGTGTTSTSTVESIGLNFSIGIPTGTTVGGGVLPAIGTTATVTATVNIGPVQSSPALAFALSPLPAVTVATLSDCVTNLLFPFMTNQVGFDTTFYIANTSSDKLAFGAGNGATAQSGTCTLSMYPIDLTTQTATAAGSLLPPSQFTTPTIPSGGSYSFTQSGTQFAGKSGYLFAVCKFLDAHGFSYVVNGTPATGTISQGLPALVITVLGTPRTNFITFESLAH